jgi:hypothetical protein
MKKAILVLVLFFVSIGHSNIRVGRTGGGLAEMKAYSVVGQLSSIVKICLNSQSFCGMNQNQINDFQNLSRFVALDKIELVAPYSGRSQLSGQTLYMNSQDLYTAGSPHKYGEILSFSLYLLLRDALHKNESEARWPSMIFSHFQENMRSLYLPNLNLTLHALSLALPQSSQNMVQALALEMPQETIDLTRSLHEAFGCVADSWTIEAWTYIQQQYWVRAPLLWNCGTRKWSGELQLVFTSQGISRFSIVRRTQLN